MKSSNLLGQKVKMNQFRNTIYELILTLKEKKKMSDFEITSHIKDIGKRILHNYIQYWIPKSDNEIDLIKEIHEFVFKKKIKIKMKEEFKEEIPGDFLVIEKDCCFCKYERPDVGKIAGCNIAIAFIEELFKMISKQNSKIPEIEGQVISSKTFGDKKCIHSYKIRGDN
ncbi:MAG: hypothetical protein EAX96_09645 [Candidatus Lokiarchaeota archaeon]|nr:hypothetical protein [Candidatus Lokiarchaeota archaeon]